MASLQPLLVLVALLSLARVHLVAPSPRPPRSGPHITDLSVLLPPRMTNPVQYRLVGSGGCFTWTWDHHDILSVEPEYVDSSGCSTSARLTSIESYGGRKESALYATDVNTGTVIRCEVFIDKIARIQIFHHSVKLDLDGLTELRIRAFDDNDNVFSSLVGLRFKWLLIPDAADGNVLHHLVHVPLKETPLSDCGGFCGDLDMQIKLEESDVGSDLYVVKGVEIGQEIVTARLLEPKVEHVMDKIVLTVAELMSLNPPSPVFVLIDALATYKLKVIRKNTPKAIDLPSPYYQWSVSNTSVAEVDLLMGTVTAISLGFTNVIVEDIRVSGHRQLSRMHVVIPERLSLYIKPVTNTSKALEGVRDYPSSDVWYIVAGQQYIVLLKAFSSKPEEKEIYLTQNNVLELESDNHEYWSLVLIEGHGLHERPSSRLLRPHSEGRGTITASLTYRRGALAMKEVLKVEQLVIVCDKINIQAWKGKLLTEVIRLPWAPELHQELELMATGGCAKTAKDYRWYSSDEGIVSISASGFVRAEHPGQAVIKVVSAYDIVNFAEVMVEISIPSFMVMLPYFPVETAVGDGLRAAIALSPSNGIYYHRCDAFDSSIRWKVISERECFRVANASVFQGLKMPSQIDESDIVHGPACSWTNIYTFCPGHATVHSTFSSEMPPNFQFSSRQIVLHASKPIASNLPLYARQAGDGNQFGGYWVDLRKTHSDVHEGGLKNLEELYLAPGTKMDIIVLGGPERWGQGVEFLDSLNVSSIGEENKHVAQDEVVVKHTPVAGGRLYTLSCQTIGDYRLVFSRGNLVGPNHFLPAIENLDLSLLCGFPFSISLIINQFANTHEVIQASVREPRGPGNIRLSPVSVANGRTIRIAAVGIHNSGRALANSSSLHLRWELSGCEELGHWEQTITSGKIVIEWEKFLVLHNATGQCTVRAAAVGLSEPKAGVLSERAFSLFQSTPIGIKDAVKLQLVSSLRIVPEIVMLVFDPEAKVNVSIIGGTCLLEAALNDTNVAEILPHPGTVECSWLMLVARRVGTSLLTIYDKGLSPPASAVAVVKVVTVGWVKVIPDEEVFMLEGTEKHFDILAGTEEGNIFDSSQYSYMNIHLHTDENILKVMEDGSTRVAPCRLYHPYFEVKAENIGIATLYVSIRGHSGNWIMNQHLTVEVYPALRIRPDYLFLAPGAAYMIAADGGPTTQSVIEFSSLDPLIAVANRSSGLLSAVSIGNTTVHVVAYGNGGAMICEAYGRVEVAIPPTVILNVQSEQLCIGCHMSLYPSYPEGNLFAFYEICKSYKWSIGDEKVLNFEPTRSWDNGMGTHSVGKVENCSHDFGDGDFGFINMVSGRSAGITNVSVSFSCDFVSSDAHHVTSYIASRMLRVVHDPPLALGIPITWVLPPHYTTSDILPDSSDSYRRHDSQFRKKGVVYSVLKSCEKDDLTQEDPIAVIGAKLKTRESSSLGCLQAIDQSGRTEIACCIRVAEVSQVRISTKERLSYIVHLGVNDQLEVNAAFYDYLGYPFLEAHGVVSLDTEINYHDVVSIHMCSNDNNYSKGHFHFQALKHGKALVKIFIKENPQKAAYILVLVGAQLFPRDPILHVGNLVNFSVLGDGQMEAMQGRWLSSNDSVISIDMLTGQAHACDAGYASVHFESSSMKLRTTVTVLEGEHIQVHAPAETLTNVNFPSKGYIFPVELSQSLLYKDGFPKVDLDNMLDCWVDPPFLGYAKPWRDHVAGAFHCLFFPYSPKHLVSFLSKLNSTRGLSADSGSGFVYVSVIASLREAQHIMGSAHAYFVGGFSVSADRMDLSSECNRSLIVLTGNTAVEINWNQKDLFAVTPTLKNVFGVAAHAEYEVRVLKKKRFKDKIIIVLPIIGQSAELDVTFDPGDQGVSTSKGNGTWAAAVACLLMLVWTVIVFVGFLDRPDSLRTVERPIPPPSSSTDLDSPLRQPGGTPSPVRTPQPLAEYVRRTIDETPYYKRDGRRLFDPRNSY